MDSEHYGGNDGLTKREYFAGQAMAGLLANSHSSGQGQPLSSASSEQIAEMVVNQADDLIKALNEQ